MKVLFSLKFITVQFLMPVLVVLLSVSIIFAQDRKTIKGKVIDENTSQPVLGTSVIVKGKPGSGVITNKAGEFVITASTSDTLVISFVGYKDVIIAAPIAQKGIIKMQPVINDMDEVVVIGYGSQNKRDLTGAISSIEGSDISERHATQTSLALQGAIPGVMVTRDNGAPGATGTIRIRGITTISDSNPLIIVDGVPISGSINDVNPNDIENISVLKDAASASIYGARAATGVILITTKKAKNNTPRFIYNYERGIEKPTVLPEFVSVQRYMEMTNELRWNDNGNNNDEFPTYSKDVIDNYPTLNSQDPNTYPITDWMGLILKGNAPKETHYLGFSAGSNAIKSYGSIEYNKVGGLFDGKEYSRIFARFNNDFHFNRFLSATANIFFKRAIKNDPIKDPMADALMAAPIYPAVWSDGRIASGKSGNNIYALYKDGGFVNNWYNQIGGKFSIDVSPLDGLKLSGVVSPTFNFNKSKTFAKRLDYYAADDPEIIVGTIEGATSTKLTENRHDDYNLVVQAIANYTKTLNRHNINAMMGYENYYAFFEDLSASSDQYQLTEFPYLDLGNKNYLNSSGSAYENAYRSYFARVIYSYQNKYIVQGNLRYDGSSRFDSRYRWGTFPSFSLGWILTEEKFMKNISPISFFKFRASWGSLGNEKIGNYPYQSIIGFYNALFFQGSDVVSAQTAAQTQYAIRDISWETTQSSNIGVDASFFNSRLHLTADYYNKLTKDMLLELEIPDYIGFDNPYQNTGKMKTKGWELSLGWNGKIGSLAYTTSVNLSNFKSVMGNLGGTEFLGSQIKRNGSEYNEWYGYKSAGLYKNQEDVDNSAKLYTSVKPGDIKYVDISGPEGKPDGIISPEYDRVLLGGSQPRYLFGANFSIQYKSFQFSIVLQGVGKQNDRLEDRMIRPLLANWGNIPAEIDGKYWSMYNSPEENLKAKYPRLSWSASDANNYQMSDYWLINSGYLRLKNLSLSYNLPKSLITKIKMEGVSIYANVSDVFKIDRYVKGWDPEVASNGYPITKSYLVGISVNF